MVKRSKLKSALDAEKGVDYRAEHQKRVRKQAGKGKKSKGSEAEESYDDEALEPHEGVDANAAKISNPELLKEVDSEEDEDGLSGSIDGVAVNGHSSHISEDPMDELEDEGIALSDLEDLDEEDTADIVPYQRLTINNTSALLRAVKSIELPISSMPFSEHQTLTSSEQVEIADVDDDLNRELAFYKQSLDAAKEARRLLKKEGVPFTRPTDYFAEMVKTDEHMGKIKQKLVDDAASKKAAAEARKQRDLKKFGKQVQVAKLQERDKAKRETMEKIKLLKRKRQGGENTNAREEDLFDVALEDATNADNRGRRGGEDARGGSKRQKRNEKFGYGGKKRFSKSGDAASSADLTGFSAKKMKSRGGSQRLGKSRRVQKR